MTMNEPFAQNEPLAHPALEDLIAQTLSSGQFPAETSPAQHLVTCQSCAYSFQQQVLLETSLQERALQAHPEGLTPALPERELAGLLALWQAALDAGTRLEDDWSVATALSVVGMLRREQGDAEEAQLVHELALKAAARAGNLFSQVLSQTDLGVLALKQQNTYAALEHLTAAGHSAALLQDREAEARARLWMLRTLAQSFMQVFGGLPDLLAQATALLRDVLLAPAQAQLKAFYRSWLQPVYSLASAVGDSLLVLNTGQRIPVNFLEGPNVDQHGTVKLRLKVAQALDPHIPAAVQIDLIFLPAQAMIGTLHVNEANRPYLMSNKGLLVSGQLPGLDDDLRAQLLAASAVTHGELKMPMAHFALQMHW
jgi:hypothetical protein